MQEQRTMDEPDEENGFIAAREAEDLSNRVFAYPGEPRAEISVLREYGIASADVEANCEQLSRQVYVFERYLGKLPCTRVDEQLIPIALPFIEGRRFPFFRWFDSWLAGTDQTVELAHIDDAKPGFTHQLRQFLRVRLDHFRGDSDAKQSWVLGGMNTQSASLEVEVHSVTTGARVLASPAYFQNFIVFGGPTSPAVGYLSPGRYIFKVSVPRGQPVIDPGVFDIPPSFSPQLFV